MKKSKFTEEQIGFALRQGDLGTPVAEVCRKMGISEATYFRWKQKYGGLGPSELRKLRQLEEENLKLKRLVAELSLDKAMPQDVLAKKSLRPARRRAIVLWLKDRYRVSERRGCTAMRFDRSTHRYRPVRDDQAALRKRMKEIAAVRVRYGYRRIHVLLRREGWAVNHERVQRLSREEGLNLRQRRPRRHVTAARRIERHGPTAVNEVWAMDFVSDALFDGRRFRALTVVDPFTRECLAVEVDQTMKADAVVATVERLTYLRGTAPTTIRVDNGPEFISRMLDHWAYRHGVTLDFSRPGKPTDNAFAESFNGRLRDECLNTHWFLSLADAPAKIEAWRRDYNECRPHTSLGLRMPAEFASLAGASPGQ